MWTNPAPMKASWALPISTLMLVAGAALLTTTGTLPAARARHAAYAKHERLAAEQSALRTEIAQLEAESVALKTDYQYNRRLERIMFRSGPERGD